MRKDTEHWIKHAEEDLEAAKLISQRFPNYSLFHSQQAFEKFLKAFLIEKDVFDPKKHKTHNLKFLIDECSSLDKDFEKLKELNLKIFEKAIEIRYPTEYKVSEKEAEEAIKIAEKVKEFVLKKI